ncbi:hypothetical protein B0H14DRAFT_3166526 [Mycena olivaceomarginata]|nr:hypothetical protein B0H14DRAFT_3166526 [Mycena olivaceomarginata]
MVVGDKDLTRTIQTRSSDVDVDEYEEDMGAVRHVSDGPSIREGSSRRNSRAKADGISTALLRRETQEQQQSNNLHSPGAAKSRKPKVHPIFDCLLFGLNRYWRQNPLSVVPVVNTQKPKPIPAAKPSKTTTVLPIKAWYLGRKCFDEPYHLVWTPNAKMTIRDNLGAPAIHTEEKDIGIVAERVLFVSLEDPVDDKVFCLKTLLKFPKKKVGNQKPIGTQFPSYFKGKAEQSKWEGAHRSAELTESRIEREADGGPSGFLKAIGAKSLAVPGMPPLDTWSPPTAIPHKRQNTEEGSPAKRQKKMQDKGVKVGSSSDQPAVRLARSKRRRQVASKSDSVLGGLWDCSLFSGLRRTASLTYIWSFSTVSSSTEDPSSMWRRCGDPDNTEVSYVDKHYEDEGQSFQRSTVARDDSYPEVYGSFPVPLGRNPLSTASINRYTTIRTTFLPIKAWYLGRKLFEEPYHLVWTTRAGIVSIRAGTDPTAYSTHSEEIDIGVVAKRVSFVPPEESGDKLLSLETFKKPTQNIWQKPIGTNFPLHFRQGGMLGGGNILIKFDSASTAWTDHVYVKFVNWLKEHVRRERLTGTEGEGKWEAARRMADFMTVAHVGGGTTPSFKLPPAPVPPNPHWNRSSTASQLFSWPTRRAVDLKKLGRGVFSFEVTKSGQDPEVVSRKRQNTEEGPSAKRHKKMQDKGVQVGSPISTERSSIGWAVGLKVELWESNPDGAQPKTSSTSRLLHALASAAIP